MASAGPLLTPVGELPAQAGLGDLGPLTDNSPAAGISHGAGLPGGGFGVPGGGGSFFPGGGGIGGGIGGGGGSAGGGPGTPNIPGVPGTPAVSPVSGTVPEPASWGLMLTGFGTMGGAIRWQRRATA